MRPSFLINNNAIKKILVSIFVSISLAIPVSASESVIVGNYSENFVKEAPYSLENRLYGEFNPNPTLDGYCVSFVQQNGFSELRGNANEWIKYIDPNIKNPLEGYAVVMSYGDIGHLGIYHNGEVWHQNFEGRGIISHTLLDRSRVIGYIQSW